MESSWNPAFRPDSGDAGSRLYAGPDLAQRSPSPTHDDAPVQTGSYEQSTEVDDHMKLYRNSEGGHLLGEPSSRITEIPTGLEMSDEHNVKNGFQSDRNVAEPATASNEFDAAFATDQGQDRSLLDHGYTRSNSFPEVPRALQEPSPVPNILPSSQVENLVNKDASISGQQEPAPITATTKEALDDWEPSLAYDGESDAAPPPLRTNNESFEAQISTQNDEEARFEEGVLLVADGPRSDMQSPTLLHNKFTENENTEEEESFYDKGIHGKDQSDPSKPYALDRKSTTQVLGSMHFAAHEASHHTLEQEVPPALLDSSAKAAVTPSDASGTKTVAEQQTAESSAQHKQDDLSEIWKAALADEDLLDENEHIVDPSSFFVDDGEGFLEEEQNEINTANDDAVSMNSAHLQPGQASVNVGFRPSNPYAPAPASLQQRPSLQSYHTTQPDRSSSSMHQGSMSNGLQDARQARQPLAPFPTPARPTLQGSAQSFVDKSKGGYKSPYDLPMDVTRPKRRAPLPTVPQSPDILPPPDNRPPPPRSSSMTSGSFPLQNAFAPTHDVSNQRPPSAAAPPPPSVLAAKPSPSSFFEELPDTKPRPSSSFGRNQIPASQPTPPPRPQPAGVVRDTAQEVQGSHHAPLDSTNYRLLPPEKLGLFGDTSPPQQTQHTLPISNAKYSPAPSHTSTVPPPVARYAASPASAPRPQVTHTLPHLPRTSSPLTQRNSLGQPQQPGPPPNVTPYANARSNTSSNPTDAVQQHPRIAMQQPQYNVGFSNHSSGAIQNSFQSQLNESPPPFFPPAAPPSSSTSASSHPIYTSGPDQPSPDAPPPLHDYSHEQHSVIKGPPRRSQTQSPNARRPIVAPMSSKIPYQRPASVNNYGPQLSSYDADSRLLSSDRPVQARVSTVNFIRPNDGRELDGLERWKGCPIVSFGFGGQIVKMFPQQIPRYAAGQKTPLIKCSPGEVKIDHGKIFALQESVKTFPGPLKTKGKKKEVLDWLQKKLSEMEAENDLLTCNNLTLPDPVKCHEERILLWKIMQIFVEYDGSIENNLLAEKAVRAILSPELNRGDAAQQQQNTSDAPLVGITKRTGPTSAQDSLRSDALEILRRQLLHGEREQAAWHAVDNRMWAHAMLIASTLDQTVSKQIAQEFVRQEVKTYGENTEPLSALFQVFAGNWEESVDELVPPSARAGLQMVSKSASSGPTRNALDGLDRWRETLTLILSNRTTEDGKALVALGQLLAGYGRTEAAHICYVFAKSPVLFGGPEDPQVSVALLGADHLRQPFDYGRDFDSILLTEVHDFARTVLASSSVSTVSPHLQSYRLYHAMILAEYGFKPEAQQYCDAILSTLKSTTKPSPYYHGLLAGSLETLQDRLRQAPRDASGSWISRPSMDKVSGSIWAKFNSYVAGDDDDAVSAKSGRSHDPASGPFAGISGETPTLSRTTSSTDLYNTYQNGTVPAPMVPQANSRYAPGGVYTPRSSLEQSRPPYQDSSRLTNNDALQAPLVPQYSSSRPNSSSGPSHGSNPYYSQASPYQARPQSYLPTPPLQAEDASDTTAQNYPPSIQQQQGYRPILPGTEMPKEPVDDSPSSAPNMSSNSSFAPYEPTVSSYQPSPSYGVSSSTQGPGPYEPTPSSHEVAAAPYGADSSSYQPPSTYDPPSYFPDVSITEASPTKENAKKSGMEFDEDGDFEARPKALREAEKAHKDREADEAFRKAAEADAERDKGPKLNSKKSGWFGGSWFSNSKEKSNEIANPNAPIKVKLGEESSFYFDKGLGKWVNKKGGNVETPSAPAPPPPKGPPSRSVSAAGGPPQRSSPTPPVPPIPRDLGSNAPPMRAVSGPAPSSNPGPSPLARNMSPATQGDDSNASGPPSAPASRPTTSQGGSNPIDDLLGLPQARKGGTVKKGKKGRGYVDVMAK